MSSYLSWNIIVEYKMILVLLGYLINGPVEAYHGINSGVRANKFEIKSLTTLILWFKLLVFEIIKDVVNCFHTHSSKGGPFTTHKTH